LIRISIDENSLLRIKTVLESNEKKSAYILRKVVNETAKKAKQTIIKAVKHDYDIQYMKKDDKGNFLKDNLEVKKATLKNLNASLVSKGNKLDVSKFKVNPNKLSRTNDRPKVYKAKVLKSSTLKKMQVGNMKAFLVKFDNGHEALVQRVFGKRIKTRLGKVTKHNQALESLYTVSMPEMFGGKHGYLKVQDEVDDILQENIYKELERALAN
jgi:hypothetical protein